MNKPGTLIGRTLLLVAVGAVTGLLVNAVRPDALPWTEPWSQRLESIALQQGLTVATVSDVQTALDEGYAIVLDARAADEFYAGAIPGAMSLPNRDRDTAFIEIQLFLTPEQPIITYCSGPACDDALLLGLFLREQGYTNTAVFVGGMEAWRAAGLSLEGEL